MMRRHDRWCRRLLTVGLVGVLCAAGTVTASARNGDVAGSYYATDIKTTVYNAPITAYNIGGRTVIDAEILNWHYGFDVYWDEASRRLDITDKGGAFNSLQALSGELCQSAAGTPGRVAGSYYETDIVTTLNGTEIESYNIGGRTCIVAEAMQRFGYDVAWNGDARTLTITKPMDFYTIETDYGAIKTKNNYGLEDQRFNTYKRGLLLTAAGGAVSELPLQSGSVFQTASGVSYVRLSDLAAALKADWALECSTQVGTTDWGNGQRYEEQYYQYTIALSYSKAAKVATTTVSKVDAPPSITSFDKSYKISDIALRINGEDETLQLQMGGKTYTDGLLVLEGKAYIPAYTAAKLLGYVSGE